MAAGIYVRISSDPTGQRAGVTRQQADCAALCQSRGWPVAEVYVDNDLSAFSGKQRPGYTRLCEDIRDGRLTHVLAWHPDRLHRSPRELEDFIDLLEKYDVRVATVQSGDWDLSNATGRMQARMLGVLARYESEHKSDRIRRALRANAEAGKPGGGGRRYGYQDDGITLHPDEAAVVRDAARRLLAGDSLRSICTDLNTAGTPTITGVPWHPTVLRQIVSSPRAGGFRVHRGDVVGEAAWQPLLDRDTWQAVRGMLSDTTRRSAPSTARVHLLTNIAVCAVCDTGLLPHHSKGGAVSYACRKPGCRAVAMRAHRLEQLVVEALLDWLERHEVAAPEPRTDDGQLAGQIAAVEARIGQVAVEFADDDTMTPEQLSTINRRLQTRLAELRARQSTQRRQTVLDGWHDQPRAAWEQAPLERRRMLLHAVFARIGLGPVSWNERRLQLEWRQAGMPLA